MRSANRASIVAATVYATACCVLGISIAISTSIHANSDDYYSDNNATIFSYHVPDDEGNTSFPGDWYLNNLNTSNQDLSDLYEIFNEGNDASVLVASVDGIEEDRGRNQAEKDSDVVENFLQLVEEYDKNKAECKPGTEYTLGPGVIKQYGLNRFQAQAMRAVNRANFLTRIWRYADSEFLQSEYLFYTQVRNIVEGDPDIFAAGNCYDKDEFKDYHLFCPFSHRTEDGRITVKDLSLEYPYLGNTSDWFFSARMRSAKLENFNITKGEGLHFMGSCNYFYHGLLSLHSSLFVSFLLCRQAKGCICSLGVDQDFFLCFLVK